MSENQRVSCDISYLHHFYFNVVRKRIEFVSLKITYWKNQNTKWNKDISAVKFVFNLSNGIWQFIGKMQVDEVKSINLKLPYLIQFILPHKWRMSRIERVTDMLIEIQINELPSIDFLEINVKWKVESNVIVCKKKA